MKKQQKDFRVFHVDEVVSVISHQEGEHPSFTNLRDEFGAELLNITQIIPVRGSNCKCPKDKICTCDSGNDLKEGVGHPQWLNVISPAGKTGERISGAYFVLVLTPF